MALIFRPFVIILALTSLANAQAGINGGVTGPSGTGGGGSGSVTSISAGCGSSTGGSPITTTGTISAVQPVDAETGSNFPIPNSDCGYLITLSNASAQTPTIAQAGGSGNFTAGWFADVCNIGAGTQTLTPTTSTINGGSTQILYKGQCVHIVSDGTNYQTAGQVNALGALSTVIGTVSTQSGTTYTLAPTDCGTQIDFTNASTVTVTIPATLPLGCNVAIIQAGASKVSVNGSAVTPATLHSAHSYTGTSGQWAIIGVNIEANSGGSSAVAVLTGDGA